VDTPGRFTAGPAGSSRRPTARNSAGGRLSLVLTAAHANAGETYTIVVESARPETARRAGRLSAAAGQLAGTRELGRNMDHGMSAMPDVAPFVLGRALPVFAAKGAGKFEPMRPSRDFPAAAASMRPRQLGAVRAELTALAR